MTARTPLKPWISVRIDGPERTCACCRSTDRVLVLGFGWSRWPSEIAEHPAGTQPTDGGRKEVALCFPCRETARTVLDCDGPVDDASAGRLSDERIRAIIADDDGTEFVDRERVAMAREIQERRAADLTQERLEAIANWRSTAIYDRLDHQPAMDAIDALLASHGVKP